MNATEEQIEAGLRRAWGIEETRNILWIGPMRRDGFKVDQIAFWLDYDEDYKPEVRASTLALAKRIVELWNTRTEKWNDRPPTPNTRAIQEACAEIAETCVKLISIGTPGEGPFTRDDKVTDEVTSTIAQAIRNADLSDIAPDPVAQIVACRHCAVRPRVSRWQPLIPSTTHSASPKLTRASTTRAAPNAAMPTTRAKLTGAFARSARIWATCLNHQLNGACDGHLYLQT